MTFKKQYELAELELSVRRISDDDEPDPSKEEYCEAWQTEAIIMGYGMDCLKLCQTIEHIMVLRYLVMSARAYYLNTNPKQYALQTLASLTEDKLDASADDDWI